MNTISQALVIQAPVQTPPSQPASEPARVTPVAPVAAKRGQSNDEPRQPSNSARQPAPARTEMQIERDELTGRIVFKSINRETGEIVRQIPSDELLKLAGHFRKQLGLLVDDRV